MVHIVFGVPQRIRRDTWNEYWIYGEEGTANALTFHFRKRRTLLDDNAYELQRSIQFRSVWDRGGAIEKRAACAGIDPDATYLRRAGCSAFPRFPSPCIDAPLNGLFSWHSPCP